MLSRVAVLPLLVLAIVGCSARVPSADSFKQPAVGTPMPGGHEESVHSDLPVGQSGALVINTTSFPIQVAVSNTIATLPIGQDFLFLLPPGSYEFYIYEPNNAPRVHTEKLEDGKLRYIYLYRIEGPGS